MLNWHLWCNHFKANPIGSPTVHHIYIHMLRYIYIHVCIYIQINTLEVQPAFFNRCFPNHHYFSKGLSSSKRNHHFQNGGHTYIYVLRPKRQVESDDFFQTTIFHQLFHLSSLPIVCPVDTYARISKSSESSKPPHWQNRRRFFSASKISWSKNHRKVSTKYKTLKFQHTYTFFCMHTKKYVLYIYIYT